MKGKKWSKIVALKEDVLSEFCNGMHISGKMISLLLNLLWILDSLAEINPHIYSVVASHVYQC